MNWVVKNLPYLFALAVYAVLRAIFPDEHTALTLGFFLGAVCGIMIGVWPSDEDRAKAKPKQDTRPGTEGTCNACHGPIVISPGGRWIHKRLADSRCPTPEPRPRSK